MNFYFKKNSKHLNTGCFKLNSLLFLICIIFILGFNSNANADAMSVKAKNGDGSFKFTYDDAILNNNSTVYSKKLASFTSGLSTMMYDSNKASLKKALKAFDYSGFKLQKDKIGTTATYMFASKKAKINGKTHNIILVIIRGTEQNEWADNFNTGYQCDVHAGFNYAATHIYSDLCNYAKEHVEGSAPVKLLITGHSRGGAVSNLLGKMVDDNGIEGTNVTSKNTFVYTYASPATTKEATMTSETYNNIFNILNSGDFITMLLPADWGYGLYGKTKRLNKNMSGKGKKLYKKLMDSAYSYDSSAETKMNDYISFVTANVTSNDEYYTKNLMTGEINVDEKKSLKVLYELTFSSIFGPDEEKIAVLSLSIAANTGEYGEVGKKTLEFFMDTSVQDALAVNHQPQTYLAKIY